MSGKIALEKCAKMKILHVINSLSTGGAEKLVADLAPLQRECGHEVEVLLLCGGESVFRVSLEKSGVRVYDFGSGVSVYSPLNILRLIPFMRKYDVIHVHLFPAQYWVAIAKVLTLSKVRLVTTEHSTNNRRRGSRFWSTVDRMIYSRYEKVVCCAKRAESALAKHLGGDKRLCTIPNGVELNRFSSAVPRARKNLGCSEDAFVLLQIARFAYPKKQRTLIGALAFLPQAYAVFVGDGEERKACEDFAVEIGVSDRVRFLGIRGDVAELQGMADAIICSSEYEGLSLASVEGMAAGKPVIASDVPGLAEVVGGAGILFPPGDEKALAEAIRKLSNDHEFYKRTAEACLRRARDFDIRKTAEAYLALYTL